MHQAHFLLKRRGLFIGSTQVGKGFQIRQELRYFIVKQFLYSKRSN